ncbi:MAG TPA: M12 family metallo-peptidase, partial [Anaerolineae bacterium]|nr:M12 family metallo-peptidase [Anaerolineae bacterium]
MMKRRILVAATLVALILSMVVVPTARPLATAMAQSEPPSPELFADPPAQTEALLLNGNGPEDQWVIRSRFVAVNYGVLSPQTGSVTLNLFPDASFDATLESSTVPDPENPERFIWRGVLDGTPNGHATLAVNGASIAATVALPGALYHVTDTGEDLHLVKQTTLQDPMPEDPPEPVIEEGIEQEPQLQGFDALPLADDGSIIDVLVVYTPAVRSQYGNNGIKSLIDLAVDETNQSYANSQINMQLRLVHTAEVAFTESTGSMGTDLGRLQSKTDGYMDEVHALRDQYHADMVSLIVANMGSCGIAYLMTTLSPTFERNAFSVVAAMCAAGYYSFGHELAHNMGANHDRANASAALYPYSYGYWAPDNSYRTVMAYDCPNGG